MQGFNKVGKIGTEAAQQQIVDGDKQQDRVVLLLGCCLEHADERWVVGNYPGEHGIQRRPAAGCFGEGAESAGQFGEIRHDSDAISRVNQAETWQHGALLWICLPTSTPAG